MQSARIPGLTGTCRGIIPAASTDIMHGSMDSNSLQVNCSNCGTAPRTFRHTGSPSHPKRVAILFRLPAMLELRDVKPRELVAAPP